MKNITKKKEEMVEKGFKKMIILGFFLMVKYPHK